VQQAAYLPMLLFKNAAHLTLPMALKRLLLLNPSLALYSGLTSTAKIIEEEARDVVVRKSCMP
jgi:hypothetical protein